jgi:DNA-binding transcriptional ArsR family regulator
MKLLRNTYLVHSEFFDFLASLFRLNNNEKLISSLSDVSKLKPDSVIKDWVESAKKSIPEDIKQKMNLFFNYETFYGMCLIGELNEFMDCDGISINDALSRLESFSPLKILEIFMGSGYSTQDEEDIESLVMELVKDSKKAADYINNKLPIPSEYKWDLFQFFINPDSMKNEFLELLRWYYEHIYINILSTAEENTKEYEKYFIKQVSIYGEDYLKSLNLSGYKTGNKTMIAFSYFYEFSDLSHDGDNFNFYMLGLKYTEAISMYTHSASSNAQMFKALSDETRLNILKLLSKRKWYGKELALKLKLSNSTVSYHLSMLLINGFIKEENSDNKIYYTFDKENTKKILCDSIDNFFD